MYDVPGSGKHHRHSGHRKGLHLTASDVRWVIVTALFPPTLVLTLLLPHALIWITLMLVTALGALTVRLMRQTGDRHYLTSPKERAANEPIKVEVTVLPSPEEVAEENRKKIRSAVIMAMVSSALLALAKHSRNQADTSRRMHDEVDEVLGLPGARLGYGAQYQANKPQWVQPPISGLNWQDRQTQELEDQNIRRVGGVPGKTDGSWQNG